MDLNVDRTPMNLIINIDIVVSNITEKGALCFLRPSFYVQCSHWYLLSTYRYVYEQQYEKNRDIQKQYKEKKQDN